METKPGSNLSQVEEASRQEDGTTTPCRNDTQHRRVLIADDEPDILKLIGRALETVGFAVSLAGDGQQAYDLFVSDAYDLVVTDLRMPVMDGFELINRIKALSPGTPVVIISGGFMEDLTPIGGPAAVAAIVHKPFQMGEFYKTVLQATCNMAQEP